MLKNDELLKKLLSLKMETVSTLIELLPGELQVHTKQVENRIISFLHELTGEFLEKEKVEKGDDGLKQIVIE